MAKKVLMQNKQTGKKRWMFTADAKEMMLGKDGRDWVPAAAVTGGAVVRDAENSAAEQARRESAIARGADPSAERQPLIPVTGSTTPMVDDTARAVEAAAKAEFPDD